MPYSENECEMEETFSHNATSEIASASKTVSQRKEGGSSHQTGKSVHDNAYADHENSSYERVIRKRKRKSGDQLKTLVREFDRNPNWTKDTLLEVSKKTGLSEAQVYKWGWD